MADELTAFCRERGRADRDPPLRVALARELARRPPAAGPAVRDDAQPRRAHPRQLPLLHDDSAHAGRHRDHQVAAFKESIAEMQEAEFLPGRAPASRAFDAAHPPVPDARLGRDKDGQPAWFVPDPASPGKYRKVDA
jgi:hypothetical protein